MENKNNIKQESSGKLISELSRSAHIYFQHEFKEYHIGHAQLRTLFFIAHNEGKTQKEIGEYLNLDKSSVTSQLQILEKNGYIRREKSKVDARKQVINSTKKTHQILPSIKQVLNGWTESILEGFTEEERSEIFAFLKKMRSNARNKLISIQEPDKGNC